MEIFNLKRSISVHKRELKKKLLTDLNFCTKNINICVFLLHIFLWGNGLCSQLKTRLLVSCIRKCQGQCSLPQVSRYRPWPGKLGDGRKSWRLCPKDSALPSVSAAQYPASKVTVFKGRASQLWKGEQIMEVNYLWNWSSPNGTKGLKLALPPVLPRIIPCAWTQWAHVCALLTGEPSVKCRRMAGWRSSLNYLPVYHLLYSSVRQFRFFDNLTFLFK